MDDGSIVLVSYRNECLFIAIGRSSCAEYAANIDVFYNAEVAELDYRC